MTPESEVPSNVLRLATSVKQEDEYGVQQVVFYDPGCGTLGGLDTFIGGSTGDGIDRNIRQLYSFLALNYDDGDEVYLFGFSRGAYTVRALSGMLNVSGLTRRNHLTFVKEAHDMYRNGVGAESEEAKAFRMAHGSRIDIELLVCFDTVRALGLPMFIPFLSTAFNNRYKFYKASLDERIKHAIHVLSIDELRSTFEPTLMQPTHPERPEQLTQLYCLGVHSGVGGCMGRISSECALRFVLNEMRERGLKLAFDEKTLSNSRVEPNTSTKISFADRLLYGFLRIVYTVTGSHVREINSLDQIHPSAIKYYQLHREWRPKALQHLSDKLMAVDAQSLDRQLESFGVDWGCEEKKIK